MKISKDQLQKIIAEEVREHVKKKLVSESKSTPRTIKATPSILKRIIAEEASKTQAKTVKATPDMLKRIIAEESARVNEMYPDHPDNKGVDYEDLDQLEDEYAKDAAEDLKSLPGFEPRYKMNMAFLSVSPKGRLEDYNTGEVLLDLGIGAYNTGTGALPDAEAQKKIDCAYKLRSISASKRTPIYLEQYHHTILDCLKKCGIVDQNAALGEFVLVDQF